MNKILDVVTIGEAMQLFVADQPGALEDVTCFQKRTAGAELNVATGLARLGLKVGWVSCLGQDSMGRHLLKQLKSEGIDCSHVISNALHPTGFMFKGRGEAGNDPPIEYHRKGSAASHMSPQDLDLPWLQGARHAHVTGIFPALSANTLEASQVFIQAMRAAGRTISFDPNLRPALWKSPLEMAERLNEIASSCDWIFPGVEEGRQLTGLHSPEEIAKFYRAKGAALVVIKLGRDGAYFESQGGSGYVQAFPVQTVVDTVGAGDGFAVGVISALLEGRTVHDAVQRGAWIGARAIQVYGDSEGLPIAAELRAAGF